MPGVADEFPEYEHPAKRKEFEPSEGSDTLYGVPKLALMIIIGNFMLWACALVSYWLGRISIINILSGMTLLVIMFAIWLAIAYIQWRFFWWLLALSASVATLALGYFLVLLITGAATLNSLHFPPYF